VALQVTFVDEAAGTLAELQETEACVGALVTVSLSQLLVAPSLLTSPE
jgi:hypothetical protein